MLVLIKSLLVSALIVQESVAWVDLKAHQHKGNLNHDASPGRACPFAKKPEVQAVDGTCDPNPQFCKDVPNAVIDSLGPLQHLIGTWEGNLGWNLVTVPDSGEGFQVLSNVDNYFRWEDAGNNYTEVITFCPLFDKVKNRGVKMPYPLSDTQPRSISYVEKDEVVSGLEYRLQIFRKFTYPNGTIEVQDLLHAETGMFMSMVSEGDGYHPWQVQRMSVIPHGNVINAVGNISQLTTDMRTELTSIAERFYTFPTTQCATDMGSREKPVCDVRDFPAPCILAKLDPVQKLIDVNEDPELDLQSTMKLNMKTGKTGSEYGSIANAPFSRAQAVPSDFESNFYIQTLSGHSEPTRLQYIQRSTLSFNVQIICRELIFKNGTKRFEYEDYYDKETGVLDRHARGYVTNGYFNISDVPWSERGYVHLSSPFCLDSMPQTLEACRSFCESHYLKEWPHIQLNTLTKRSVSLPCSHHMPSNCA